ncbi:heavy-metal-associated domain-containing protein [Microlunatus aurantiacus]|uniref:Heavy-metal-associated domain-containing protein n=1 Tax=Microlunatus aurantiacus TaxID=446786 RepID=A0ABP7DL99_9ACTN
MSTTTEYVVTGMTCAHCVKAVTEEVTGLTGVTDVAVDLTSGALTVVSDTDLPFSEIERAVDEAGYTVAPA